MGTLVLTTGLRAASELRLTTDRSPVPLGTVFSSNRMRAKALGYALHFVAGLAFAFVYYAIFVPSTRAAGGWGRPSACSMHCSPARRW